MAVMDALARLHLGLGMRGGPRGRRWSWRRAVPPAIDFA